MTTRSQRLASLVLVSENPSTYTMVTQNLFSPDAMNMHQQAINHPTNQRFLRNENCRSKMGYQIECSPQCLEVNCRNKRIQNGRLLPPEVIVRRSDTKGFVLLAGQNFEEGDLICEYLGDVITPEELATNISQSTSTGLYVFDLLDPHAELGLKIDAERNGSVGRFLSHACFPNADAAVWIIDGQYTVAIFATQKIKINHEITISYGPTYEGHRIKCLCGHPRCRKIIC